MEEESSATEMSSVRDPGPGLRLRSIKTNRVQEGTIPSTSYLEENWDDEPMTPAGRVFFEPTFDCVCVCILGFKNPTDSATFKHHVEMTLMKHKRFASKVESRNGRPWWTQVNVDVNDHVLDTEFTAKEKADPNFVLNYTTDVVIQKPFDKSRPLWDIHLVDAKLGPAVSCAIIRIHHALGDGTSLISLLMASTRKCGKPDALPTLPSGSDSTGPPKKLPSLLVRLYLAICRFVVTFWYSLTEIGKFAASLMWLKDSETPIKGSAGCEHQPKKYRFATVDVDDLKYVAKEVGGTINDVFVAMAANGLRTYMDQHYHKSRLVEGNKPPTLGQVDAKTKEGTNQKQQLNGKGEARSADSAAKMKILNNARVRALALINTRATPGLPELADMMNGSASQARWGNHMGYLLLELPMKHYKNPLDLVREAMATGNRKKSSLEGPFTYASGSAAMFLLGEKIATKLVYRTAIHTTLSMSNVKGPSQEVMFAENPITHIIPSVIGQPHALCLHLQSYNGEICLVAMAIKEIIPDPENILQLCLEGLKEMKAAAIAAKEKK